MAVDTPYEDISSSVKNKLANIANLQVKAGVLFNNSTYQDRENIMQTTYNLVKNSANEAAMLASLNSMEVSIQRQIDEHTLSSQSASPGSTYSNAIMSDSKATELLNSANLGSSLSLEDVPGAISSNSILAGMTDEVQNSEAAQAAVGSQTAMDIGALYRHGSGRLVDFTYTDGTDDDSRRAYMQLQGETTALTSQIAGEDKDLLQSVYNHLINGYTSIIITSVQENLMERQSIMPTIGDNFAATFSGAEPQILVISGLLPFDASAEGSWFISFLNAYKFFIRASKLAQFRCSLKITFPDFTSYTCYPVSINNSLVSDQDNIIPFSMTAVVIQPPPNKAYGYDSSVTEPENTAEEVAEETSDETKQADIEKEVTKDPKEVAKTSEKKSFVDSVSSWVNKVTTSKEMQEVNKALTVANQVSGAISSITGKPYGSRYYSGKIGRGTYD